nr:type ISP restriction/modification enzyme [Schumannella luteola]
MAEYAQIAPDTRTKGLYFERLVKKFLEEDPYWSAQLETVWLWNDWPGRDGKVDTGIDLVAVSPSGEVWAIQCKFYAESYYLQKGDIDSFFTASGKTPFTRRLIVSTVAKWSKHAEDALEAQQIPVQRIGLSTLDDSRVDWSTYRFSDPDRVGLRERKQLRDHQVKALGDVITGFGESDRGQLIMACGTGKTMTGLRIAERVVGSGGSVLFLVPSIALLAQTLTEWTQEAELPIRSFAICSDNQVGRNAEDLRLRDLEIGATTNAEQLIAALATPTSPETMTVFFSTYQSIGVVHAAQEAGLVDFDLVLCDEAHRTAGVIEIEEKRSDFVRVHDNTFVRADKRLYMTATPKLYGESAKRKADEASVEVASMDRVEVFGPVFHKLGFGTAVEQNLLSDYKVLVLAVSEDAVNESFQKQFALAGSELNIPDAARVAGIYKALSKTAVEGLDEASRAPMRRAVAFATNIKASQQVQQMLDGNAALSTAVPRRAADLVMQAQHVDGSMNILERTQHLDWLKGAITKNETRILTNARCLSEGVDVPALDAVIFLNPRNSHIDVVQSVGRVMRKAEGKDYGYVILPIAIPAGSTPEEALDDNDNFRVVWQVLQALRAHDDRFAATVEAIRLNPGGTKSDQVQVIAMKDFAPNRDSDESTGSSTQQRLDFTPLGEEWNDAIYAKLVRKVGVREYWENWAVNVAEIATRQSARIRQLLDTKAGIRREFDRFVKGLRANLNESITEGDALDMLAQHIITEPVLEILFDDFSFRDNNPVAAAMGRMLDALADTNVDSETKELADFYAGVRRSVGQITDAQGKQRFLKQLYERFFRLAMKKASERLGIVYTPNEIVDFILRSVDELSREHFGKGLADEGVHILDPFTGTGTFLAQLILDKELMPDHALPHKFRNELWANEINLLAYYVAAANLEQAYRSRMGGNYVAFPHIALTDTFQNTEDGDQLDAEGVFEQNNEVVVKQQSTPMSIVLGNPPWAVGQTSANEDNQNLRYPTLRSRIDETYVSGSAATLSKSMYDAYVSAFRWASDGVAKPGIVAFVTNSGFLSGNSADGFRKALVDEFDEIYVFNLRGATREPGPGAGGNVFGVRVGVAVTVLVSHGGERGSVHYGQSVDNASVGEKLAELRNASIRSLATATIVPNQSGDWLDQRTDQFSSMSAMGETRSDPDGLIGQYGMGTATNRDAWVYSKSAVDVLAQVGRLISEYNRQVEERTRAGALELERDPKRISWSRKLVRAADGAVRLQSPTRKALREVLYRPFNRELLFVDRTLNESPSRLTRQMTDSNRAIVVTSPSSHFDFCCVATDLPIDLHTLDSAQAVVRFRTPEPAEGELDVFGASDPIDNVTDEILAEYRRDYDAAITKDDIFHFVYGVLHSPEYRTRFAADLKRTLPRIPKVGDFWSFANAGKELMELHIGYEEAELYELDGVPADDEHLLVTQMKYGGKRGADKTTVIYNEHVTLTGIPEKAQEYKLGSRSALDWILERYRVKTDKASGIVNDANKWGEEHGNPRYILELIQRIVTVSLRTVDLVDSLPPLNIPDDPAAASTT